MAGTGRELVLKIQNELEDEGFKVSIRWLCRVLRIPRSRVYRKHGVRPSRYRLNGRVVKRIRCVIDQHPYFGLRRIHWKVNRDGGCRVNRKAIHRVLKLKGWTIKKRPTGMRPRVKGWKSRTNHPDTRWAIDTSHFSTERDGWCHITAVIDCCDRQIVGWRVSRSGKADVATAALEDALIRRRPLPGLRVRSDNGLVFASKVFTQKVRSAGLKQEYITPYTPEQNGLIERWFGTLKNECLWLRNFVTLSEARDAIDKFVETYNSERPHRALNMLTPSEWRDKFAA